jgi:hypothetical protein
MVPRDDHAVPFRRVISINFSQCSDDVLLYILPVSDFQENESSVIPIHDLPCMTIIIHYYSKRFEVWMPKEVVRNVLGF